MKQNKAAQTTKKKKSEIPMTYQKKELENVLRSFNDIFGVRNERN